MLKRLFRRYVLMRVIPAELQLIKPELSVLASFISSNVWKKWEYVLHGILIEKVLRGESDEYRKGFLACLTALKSVPQLPAKSDDLTQLDAEDALVEEGVFDASR